MPCAHQAVASPQPCHPAPSQPSLHLPVWAESWHNASGIEPYPWHTASGIEQWRAASGIEQWRAASGIEPCSWLQFSSQSQINHFEPKLMTIEVRV